MKPLRRVLPCLLITGCIGTDYIDDPVAPPLVARLVVTPSAVALQPGQSVQLQAQLVDVSGATTPASGVAWTSSDTTVVDISSAGVALARAVGQARIIAQSNTLTSDAALVTVVTDQNQVARVDVTPQSVQRRPGETQQFIARAYNLNNQIISGRPVSWTSGNSSVVTIGMNGLAEAHNVGTASIVATIDGIQSQPATFSVNANSRRGTFVMRPGSGHDVRGTATLTQQANGSLALAFGSDFSSAGGPDVRVYLSTTNTVTANSLDLGRLRSYTGAQSYSVPSNIQLYAYDWVIIHCVPFNITFGYARLQ